ncbi:MAG: glycosyltransferase involved in cell wall biosynthesis [Planctomycetota bacterium]
MKPQSIVSESTKSDPVRVGLMIPAFNEEAALPLVLAEIPREHLARLVVVDNASTDNTSNVASEAGAQVVYEGQQGYGQACLAGIAALLKSDADSGPSLQPNDVIVFLDGDHSDYPADLPTVIAPILEDRADLVIGSRILGGASMDALLPQAWFGNRLACFLLRVLFGARHTDLGPFRAIRVRALEHLRMADRDYGWTIEMQLKARTARMRVVEVPVRYRQRTGVSKITGTWRGTLLASWKILGWIFSWRIRLFLRPGEIPTYR